ncbi:MAG: hypothetical protein SH809_20710 [Rhodothermales bacterium]|nr:hypothetical protein [Rhodothermales bacterium]
MNQEKGKRKKEEGKRKKEEGKRKKEKGRREKEEGKRKKGKGRRLQEGFRAIFPLPFYLLPFAYPFAFFMLAA